MKTLRIHSKTKKGSRRVAKTGIITAVLVLFLTAPSLQAQIKVSQNDGPSLAGVTDVTGGLQYLLQDDDLVLMRVEDNKNTTTTSLTRLKTDASKVKDSGTSKVAESTFNDSFNAKAGTVSSQAAGRMYSFNTDTIAVFSAVDTDNLTPANSDSWVLTLFDPANNYSNPVKITTTFNPHGTVNTRVLMGDFTGDRLADPLVFYSTDEKGSKRWGMVALTAINVKSETDKPATRQGVEFKGEAGKPMPLPQTLVFGDFNNDGRDEIAALLDDYSTVAFYSIDPTTLTITQVTTVALDNIPVGTNGDKINVKMKPGQVALAAGRLRDLGQNSTNADLVIFGQIDKGENGYSVIPILITPVPGAPFTAVVVPQAGAVKDKPFYRFTDYHGATGAIAQIGSVANWPQQTGQQLVLGIQTHDLASYIEIGDFAGSDPTTPLNTFQWYSETERKFAIGFDFLYSLSIGNFDNQTSNKTHSIQQQIETQEYIFDGFTFVPHILIFDVNVPANYVGTKKTDWLKQKEDYDTGITLSTDIDFSPRQDTLVPADTQGRSLRLGVPVIVRVNQQIQPNLILAVPPMHVDYVTPITPDLDGCGDGTKPCVLNVSVDPSAPPSQTKNAFATNFSYTTATENTNKNSSTTSWGVSVKSSLEAEYTFEDGEENASGSIKDTAKTVHKENVKHTWENYNGQQQSLEETTGFADYVIYNQQSMNMYYYPVLGCESPTKCYSPTDDPHPTYISFSVPNQSETNGLDGTQFDWYQPVHEPGNVLSYPWSIKQLGSGFTNDVVPLTTSSSCNGIGTSDGSRGVSWTNGSSNGDTSGSLSSYSNEVSVSTSVGAGISDVDDVKFTSSIDIKGFSSFKTMNSTNTALSSSKGITFTIPSFDNTSTCCNYGFVQYIFGLQNKSNPPSQAICMGSEDPKTTDCIPIFNPDTKNNPPKSADYITKPGTGPLFTAYLAEVRAGNNSEIGCSTIGSFWDQVYNTPDVALNHPERWNWTKSTQTVAFNAIDRNAPVTDQPFYDMRGFFITKKDTTTSGTGQTTPTLPASTNLTEAGVNDTLTLTTRVYNYSLIDTSTATPVHVRFYGQLYCGSEGSTDAACQNGTNPCKAGFLCGDSFQIGQDQVISQIPGFRTAGDNPNWMLSQVDLLPSSYSALKGGNVYMMFWVVVWMQDASGKLVQEMPDHGLRSIPSASIKQIDQEPMEDHSNNVGLYGLHTQFHILPAGIPVTATQGTASLVSISLTAPPQVLLESRSKLVAKLQAKDGTVRAVNVAYYDGSASNAANLINRQLITSLDSGSNYIQNTFYRPTTCGTHTLSAYAWVGSSPAINATAAMNVTIQPADLVTALIASTQTKAITNTQLTTSLVVQLNAALLAYQQSRTDAAERSLSAYMQQVAAASGKGISNSKAQQLIGQASILFSCSSSGFLVAATSNAATVPYGGSATYALTVTPSGGFQGTVNFACTGAPSGTTCSLSSPSVKLDGLSQSPLTVTITSTPGTAAAGMMAGPPASTHIAGWWLFPFLSLLAMASLRRTRIRSGLLGCLVAVILIGCATGCGSGTNGAATRGTYQITVQGTSGTTTANETLTLTVQ